MGPNDTSSRQVFLDNLVGGKDAHLSLGPGISVCRLKAGGKPGLALLVDRGALEAGQLERVLERLFEQAVAFDGCFACLDARDALVIWHALPAGAEEADEIIGKLLSLGCLDMLDVHRYR
ncbi:MULTISPECIES: transcriptional regulator [unclassified Pseudomonas]|jgi:hypothetical protein|uniref:transcriptional regulator n=1 Tax=unclassified Pseudomonas TaxID=196821 RepID=UPI0015A3FBF0|nr:MULTISPECIES: transcriptional regulator [unclassified Pseudomonas]NWB63000.1 transcriptional regulator [Pseudomonas sp. F1002]NWC05174.1 transcriptional regulator [Pseudomonas sp. G1002]